MSERPADQGAARAGENPATPPRTAYPPALRLVGIEKAYPMAGGKLEVLRGVDLTVPRGMILAILGASGAGKSTLLHVAGGLDRPDAGSVWVEDRDLTSLDREGIARFRARRLGFVFQFHHLLPEFTALENVMLPALWAGASESEARTRAKDSLVRVGLSERWEHRPSQLSGGEQQRVAVARAIVNRPDLILADEPSGNLDRENAQRLAELLVSLATENGQAVVVATHNERLAALASAVLVLDGGRVREPLPMEAERP